MCGEMKRNKFQIGFQNNLAITKTFLNFSLPALVGKGIFHVLPFHSKSNTSITSNFYSPLVIDESFSFIGVK